MRRRLLAIWKGTAFPKWLSIPPIGWPDNKAHANASTHQSYITITLIFIGHIDNGSCCSGV